MCRLGKVAVEEHQNPGHFEKGVPPSHDAVRLALHPRCLPCCSALEQTRSDLLPGTTTGTGPHS